MYFGCGTKEGSGTIDQGQHASADGLHLLFAKGKRPDGAAIKEFVAGQSGLILSHGPARSTPMHLVVDEEAQEAPSNVKSRSTDFVWAELLRDGLTYDLEGIAPGPACDFAETEFRFDLDRAPSASMYESLRLLPGQHLIGGANTIPIMRGMVGLARDITHHFEHVEVVIWPPAKCAIGRRFFESASTAWLEGGAFPALGLTAFKQTVDGALQSVGLDFWVGQELRLEPPLAADKVSATRLGVRLVNHLVLAGKVEESERIVAPDGTRLVMRPSENQKFVRVWRD
ncbi:MAG: hypothetical protein ABJP48_09160 [Erythrobacter sp.]